MQKKRKIRVNNKIKLSNTVRMLIIVVSIIIIAIGSGNLIKSITNKIQVVLDTDELYKYSNKFTSNTKINLKDNDYIKENEMIDDQAYLSDLISNIDMDLNYEYKGSKSSEITYNYKIEAIVNAKYTNSKDSYNVLNKTELLKEKTNETINTNNLKINENINVNYTKYHQLIKDFKQTMGIGTDSNLYIKLTVNTVTNVLGKKVENKYESNYKITLGDKVAIIEENAKDENTKLIKDELKTEEKVQLDYKGIVISSLLMIFGIILLNIVLKKTEELRTIKNEFKLELNRIMKSYEDKIVEIEDINNIDVENATKVKDIIQLRKLAEEALAPIYCYIKEGEDEEKAYFIVTKYEKNYIYILK